MMSKQVLTGPLSNSIQNLCDIIPRMRTERNEKSIDIYLTAKEVNAIQEGQTISDRPGVTMPDAKVEVLPLSAFEPDDSLKDRYSNDRLAKGLSAPLRGNLLGNGDLQVIVPAIALTDVRISRVHLPREMIKTPLVEDGDKLVEQVIPKGGVRVLFGGSLRIVDVDNYCYP